MVNKLKNFYWQKSNFEKVQLGLSPQWQWYTTALSFNPIFNFSFACYFFGISFHSADIFLIPTIRFNLFRRDWKTELKDFTIYFQWLNINIMLILGHMFYKPFKGKKSKEQIDAYKRYLNEINKITTENL